MSLVHGHATERKDFMCFGNSYFQNTDGKQLQATGACTPWASQDGVSSTVGGGASPGASGAAGGAFWNSDVASAVRDRQICRIHPC